jgi:hypothetical protein
MPKNLVVHEAPATNRLAAARGILDNYAGAGRLSEPDWRAWSVRLAGALSSVTSLAEDAIGLNREMADIFAGLIEGAEH